MKRRLILITTLIAVGALAIVPFVYAGPGRHMRAGGHGFGFGFLAHIERLGDELDLSEAQTQQLRAIFREVREQNEQYREQMHSGFKGVAETLLANPNDLAGAQALLDQQQATERALKANILSGVSKALNVLTPDQRAKLAAMVAEHGERWGRRSH